MRYKLNFCYFLSLSVLVFCLGCASSQNSHQTSDSDDSYQDLILEVTRRHQGYSGLFNKFDVQGTPLNNKVVEAQVLQKARIYKWTQALIEEEKTKQLPKLQNKTEFFISFYTPEKKHDSLHKNKTLWNIFLDTDLGRFEGQATKIKLLPEELQSLYPYHTKFATAYLLQFPVPMQKLENSKIMKLTITGPVGTAQLIW